MNKTSKFIKFFIKNKYVAMLLFIGVVTHYLWLNPFSILFSWDLPLWTDDVARSLWPLGEGAYMSFYDYGYANPMVFYNLNHILWGLMGSFMFGIKMTLMIPIVFLSVFSPYFLVKYLIENEKIAFVCSLFFGFTVSLLFLELSHLPIAFVLSLSPLIFLRFMKLMRNFSYESTVLFGVLFSVGIWYEIRIMYALCFILIFYWLFFGYWKDFWKHKEKYALLAGVVVLLNAFWILPSAFGVSESLEAATSRGVTDTGSGILNSMTNYNDKWSGELVVQSFSGASIPWWAWVGPILAFSVLAYFKKIRSKKDGKNILFFAFVTLFGLLLSKQGDPPFGGLFDWLYDNFPGFSVYRVGARFLFIVALGYTGLLAYSIKYLIVENKKIHVYAKNGMLVFLSVVFLWNAKPLVTKEVGNLFVNKIEPTEYQVLNDFISSQDGFFRTAWFPRPSVWGYFSNEKPRINMSSVAKKELKNFYDLDRSDDFNVFHPFKTSYGNDLADFSGIKYFIIPMADDQDEMLYVEGDKSRNKLVSEIKNLDFLEKVELEGLGDILVYENKGVRPHIFLLRDIYDNVSEKELPSIRFERISPTKKKVKIIGAKGSFYVVMSEKYNPGWKLTREQMGFLRAINPGDAKGVVFDDRQERFLGFLNAWRVDSSEICENTKCQKNNDGTVDLNLTIEFWPQRWYHLGILVTLVSLGLVLIFLIYSRLTENKK